MEKAFYSATAFFIWIRVIHLLKCFLPTAYLLRMGSEIIYRMRYLICFILISLLAFGFTFYFLSDKTLNPIDGIQNMFLLLVGNFDTGDYDTGYLTALFIMVICVNFFFLILTLLIAFSV